MLRWLASESTRYIGTATQLLCSMNGPLRHVQDAVCSNLWVFMMSPRYITGKGQTIFNLDSENLYSHTPVDYDVTSAVTWTSFQLNLYLHIGNITILVWYVQTIVTYKNSMFEIILIWPTKKMFRLMCPGSFSPMWYPAFYFIFSGFIVQNVVLICSNKWVNTAFYARGKGWQDFDSLNVFLIMDDHFRLTLIYPTNFVDDHIGQCHSGVNHINLWRVK